MFSLICAWTNGGVNNLDAGDMRRHCAHYDVTVMDMLNTGWKMEIINPIPHSTLSHAFIKAIISKRLPVTMPSEKSLWLCRQFAHAARCHHINHQCNQCYMYFNSKTVSMMVLRCHISFHATKYHHIKSLMRLSGEYAMLKLFQIILLCISKHLIQFPYENQSSDMAFASVVWLTYRLCHYN